MKMMLFAVLALYPMMVFGRVPHPHSRKVLHEELNEIPPPEKYDGDVLSDSSKDFQVQMKDWVKVSLNTPKILAVQVGDRIEIECEALGGPKPTLAWNKGLHPRPIAYEETNNVNGMSLGRIISRLRFDCIQPEDEGMYSCSAASGTEFATSHHTMIFVHNKNGSHSPSGGKNCKSLMEGGARSLRPHIDQWTPILMEVIGNDITLQCIISGNPVPDLFWLDKDEKLIENGADSRFKILEGGDLLIRKLRWSDMGSYTCIAQNSAGQAKETSFVYPMSE
ncbi:zwei Ig domain protein zig-2 isoform X2 [Nilaparvata lugens]|nr:zwei Ig domain protein zig-2 isoform X2 [Nilaparvata lugens]XP_022197177.1 zwei Ig domain protein zig-2 isoform X2 [Nilaparvata lugens]XP_022197179.1 zwei Ig domain protein zig-2 isoform X2 [Nilaparvata lugens]XP_039285993.1 zwei Ig domain protein zig-2 isoform X2 [Nilaparvata lugens]